MTVYFRHPNTAEGKPQRHEMSEPVLLPCQTGGGGFYWAGGKTILDYLLVIAALPVVVPLIGFLALLVALGGASPFYRQPRVGRNGKIFHILKLRTMVPDAEHILQEHLETDAEAQREWDHKQKLRDDPRITRLGCILRKASLDELPQLWNVLRGEMSLIGPRPMMVDQQVLYPNPGAAYYRLRPGITGLWQVSDRNQSSFAERATYDIEYYNSLSLKTDLSIFIRTIGVMLRGTGY